MLHAAALAGGGMRQVLSWALRHDLHTPMAVLGTTGQGADIAVDVLAGIAGTEERERSGIFSTAAAPCRPTVRRGRSNWPSGPTSTLPGSPSGPTPSMSAHPARYQALMAPVVVAFLEQVRAATYRAAAEGTLRLPVTLVLDEVANVAPLPDLPAMVSEGGGQGLLILACLQDLSQARAPLGRGRRRVLLAVRDQGAAPGHRRHADPGRRVPARGPRRRRRPLRQHLGLVVTPPFRQYHPLVPPPARLPVDQAHSLPAGAALVVAGAHPPAVVHLTSWWDYPPFSEARLARPPANWVAPAGVLAREGTAKVPLPPPPAAGAQANAGPDELAVSWRRVPGQRRLQPPPPRL